MHVQQRLSLWRAFRRMPSAAAAALMATTAAAVEIDTNDPDLKVRWDNTVKYGAAVRTSAQSAGLLGNANQDDETDYGVYLVRFNNKSFQRGARCCSRGRS